MAALALLGGCALDLTGSAGIPGSDDAGADVWSPPDAAGGMGDSASPGVVDAAAERTSLGFDATNESSVFVPDARDEVDIAGDDAAGADVTAVDAAGADAGAPDAAGADSSGNDASARPDASCSGVFCNGVCTTEADCHACSGATLLCAATNTCLADCTSCGTATTACYACDTTRANSVGTCGDPSDPNSAYCLGGAYAYHCGCTTAADCPGATQVCDAPASGTAPPNWCYTCGENIPMATGACKNGKTCDPQSGQCR
jgi:hypothetical protein